MNLRLAPLKVTEKSVISFLFVDGKFQCYVLEPPNPIPPGTYEIKLEHSVKFQRVMPVLQSVPGHTAIEIHWGNTAADTKDCLIVGKMYGPDFVGESVDAFNELFSMLQAAVPPLTIDVTRVAPPLPAKPPVVEPKGEVKMADPTPAPASTNGKFTLTNHAPASAGLVVGSATSIVLAVLKAKLGIDLAGQETNVAVVLGAMAAYLTKGAIE